jgi:hypothetical protein
MTQTLYAHMNKIKIKKEEELNGQNKNAIENFDSRLSSRKKNL